MRVSSERLKPDLQAFVLPREFAAKLAAQHMRSARQHRERVLIRQRLLHPSQGTFVSSARRCMTGVFGNAKKICSSLRKYPRCLTTRSKRSQTSGTSESHSGPPCTEGRCPPIQIEPSSIGDTSRGDPAIRPARAHHLRDIGPRRAWRCDNVELRDIDTLYRDWPSRVTPARASTRSHGAGNWPLGTESAEGPR
jgi:hypothetical protein